MPPIGRLHAARIRAIGPLIDIRIPGTLTPDPLVERQALMEVSTVTNPSPLAEIELLRQREITFRHVRNGELVVSSIHATAPYI